MDTGDRHEPGGQTAVRLPLLIYDGECGFCRLWIERWKALTRDRVEYAPYQEVASRFPEIPAEDFRKSVQLILPEGKVLAGAHAVFRVLACVPRHGWMLFGYEKLPGVAGVSEGVYRLVAKRRRLFSKLTHLLWGRSLLPPSYVLTRWVFLRLLGLVYFVAFASLSGQVTGLVGSRGLLPVGRFLEALKANFGWERYLLCPSLAWLNSSDAFLRGMSVAGALLSLLLILDIAALPVLIALCGLYLSLVAAGQDFMMFQWDALLIETGFLAIFFAPLKILPGGAREREPSRAVLWLLRLLLFRLMFSSGAAKLLSGDPTWRRFTALSYHHETQPLPTPMGWFAHQLPPAFHEVSVAVMFLLELAVPFLIFAPRRARFFAGTALVVFQIVIAISGNYTFFGLLTVVLCVLLFDDACWVRLVPRRFGEQFSAGREAVPRALGSLVATACLALVLVVGGIAQIPGVDFERRLPRPAVRLLGWIQSLRIVNRYGLFAVMTTSRPEIVIEGSRDGQTWIAYEFKYKPGDVRRPPRWVAPYQPRLDWQMWFAALGSYQRNPWFVNLLHRLLQGSPEVLALMGRNPFPSAPPRYIRAVLYDYRFTDFATRRATGAWWRGEPKALYFPASRLR